MFHNGHDQHHDTQADEYETQPTGTGPHLRIGLRSAGAARSMPTRQRAQGPRRLARKTISLVATAAGEGNSPSQV